MMHLDKNKLREVLVTDHARALLILLKEEPLTILQFTKRLGRSRGRAYTVMRELVETGLIRKRLIRFPRAVELSLTEKGKEVAKAVEDYVKKLESIYGIDFTRLDLENMS